MTGHHSVELNRGSLSAVSRDFGLDGDYKIEASLYKLLLYKPGCFFLRHRDNERLDGMFGTLVLELPSEYEGAKLSVWSPLTPNEKMAYSFNGGNTRPKKRTRSSRPGLHFAAFYADCYHEVSELTSGHRVALVYHLTATVSTLPADESVSVRLARLVETFAQEGDNAYPSCGELGKPKKLVIVLSHHYTPASLTSIQALKGSDRSIAELILAAAFRSPADASVPRLARMAAKKVIEAGGEEFATNPDFIQVRDLISEEFKELAGGPFFDAAISLATVWDTGDEAPYIWGHGEEDESEGSSTFRTTGPLISLTGDALDLGPTLPNDVVADWHPSYFGGQDNQGPPFQYFSNPFGLRPFLNGLPAIYGDQAWARRDRPGNHSLPIYSHELLFASEEARIRCREDSWYGKHLVIRDTPDEVEFLGNGAPYDGRIYSRAVILIWPKAHRQNIQMQTKGGKKKDCVHAEEPGTTKAIV